MSLFSLSKYNLFEGRDIVEYIHEYIIQRQNYFFQALPITFSATRFTREKSYLNC